jgi:hypothetical protein
VKRSRLRQLDAKFLQLRFGCHALSPIRKPD